MELTTRTLGEISDKVGGIIRTGPFGSQLHDSDYVDEGIPVIMPKNIIDGRILTEDIAYITEANAQRLAQHRLRKGDIVYGRRGDIGRRALITGKQDGWICGTGCLRISLGNKILDSLFLYYYLGHPAVINWITNHAIGATLPNLNTSILRSVKVAFPPLPIQHTIASILSAYDDLIENNMRRIAVLEEMAQMLYQEWFVKFRFPGHEQVKMVESELGMIPEGWEVVKLGDACSITMGQSPSSQFYNEYGNGLPFHQGVSDFGNRIPTDRVYCTVENRVALAGDILFSVRAPVGRLNIASKKIVIGRGLCAIRSKSESQRFIFQQLKERFQEEDSIGNGSIFKAVTKEEVHNIKLIWPPQSLILSFEEHIQSIFSLIEVVTVKTTILRRTRDLLLPRLISGEIDVSSWVGSDGEEAARELAGSVAGAASGYESFGSGQVRRVAEEAGPVEPIERDELEWRSLWE